MADRGCECPLPCPCNVPVEGRSFKCVACMNGDHMDRAGVRYSERRLAESRLREAEEGVNDE